MAKKYLIALDDGHGQYTAGKRTPPLKEDLYIDGKLVKKKGQTIHENEFNKAVVNYLSTALKRCGFDTILVAPGDNDISLQQRVLKANKAKADAYISKHYNALGQSWQNKAKGLVTIVHYNCQARTKTLANNVHVELWKLHKDHNCRNYGVRTDKDVSGFSLYVLRNTNMMAILTESGFMDNVAEAYDMLDPTFQKADAEATCKGICKTFGKTYIPPNQKSEGSNNKQLYLRVVANEVNVRSQPVWDDFFVIGKVKKGEVFTIVKKCGVEKGGEMYKLKSGFYITANSKYVTTFQK